MNINSLGATGFSRRALLVLLMAASLVFSSTPWLLGGFQSADANHEDPFNPTIPSSGDYMVVDFTYQDGTYDQGLMDFTSSEVERSEWNDVSGHDPVMDALVIHTSCSDGAIEVGVSKTDKSDFDGHRIADWRLVHYKDGQVDKSCGPPPQPTIDVAADCFIGPDGGAEIFVERNDTGSENAEKVRIYKDGQLIDEFFLGGKDVGAPSSATKQYPMGPDEIAEFEVTFQTYDKKGEKIEGPERFLETTTIDNTLCNQGIDIDKTNDANGDSTFTDAEFAPSAGADVTFEAVITNTAGADLELITLEDRVVGSSGVVDLFAQSQDCAALEGTVLAAGASTSCQWTMSGYSPSAGVFKDNIVKVVGAAPSDSSRTVTAEDDSTVSTLQGQVPQVRVEIDKTNDADGNGTFSNSEVAPSQGADVDFEAVISNPGTEPVEITDLTDTVGNTTDDICTNLIGTVLQPGDDVTCEWTMSGYAPAQGEAKINTAFVRGEHPNDPDNFDTDDDDSVVVTPTSTITVQIDKTNDADENDSFNDSEEAAAEGDAVDFRAVITNTSNVDVTITDLTDTVGGTTVDLLDAAFCPSLDGATLSANGGSETCEWTMDGYAPAEGPGKVNTAEVTVTDGTNSDSDSDTSTVTTTGNVDIRIDKTNDANDDGIYNPSEEAPSQGAEVDFRAVVTNTSSVPVEITDLTDTVGGSTTDICSSLVGQTLQPGEDVTCEWTMSDYAPAEGAGKVNTARVDVIHTSTGRTADDTDQSTVTTTSNIRVRIDKTNDADDDSSYHSFEIADAEGDDVDFRAVVTNNSNVDVEITDLTDTVGGTTVNLLDSQYCPGLDGATLSANGGTATCDWTMTGYAPSPSDAGKTNVAEVTVADVNNPDRTDTDDDDSTVVTRTPNVRISIDKTNDADDDGSFSDVETADAQGDAVEFQAVITNTGDAEVEITALTDTVGGNTINLFNQSTSCGNLDGATLAIGDSTSCTWTMDDYAPTAGNAKVNTAEVTVEDVNDPTRTDRDDDDSTVLTRVPDRPAVNIDKTNDADGQGGFSDVEIAPNEGATVPFQAVITNSGPVTVTIDSLNDTVAGGTTVNLLDAEYCPQLAGASLAPGDSRTCTWSMDDYAPASTASGKVNTARVTVRDANNQTATDADDSTVLTTTPEIELAIAKTNDADGDGSFTDVEVAPQQGASVPFRVVISNPGSGDVAIDSLRDTFPGNDIDLLSRCDNIDAGTVVAVGGQVTCEFTLDGYAPADNTSKLNTVTVTGHEDGNPDNSLTRQDTSVVLTSPPQVTLSIVKTNDADGDGTYNDTETADAPDATVPFRAEITNTSSVPVVLDDLTDTWTDDTGVLAMDLFDLDECDFAGDVLQPGEFRVCEWELEDYAPAEGRVQPNTATVTGHQQDNPDNTATANDDSRVVTLVDEITVEVDKSNDANGNGTFTDREGADAAGADVPFRLVITNTSDEAIRITGLLDEWSYQDMAFIVDLLDEGQCDQLDGRELAAGESVTCTFTLGDYAPPAGLDTTNTVRVEVEDADNPDETASDEDDSTVFTPITTRVDKTNDANGDGIYSDEEISDAEGQDVDFLVTVTNTSAVDATIVELTDTFGGQTIDLLGSDELCGDLAGVTLQPGESVDCEFTLTDYTPAEGDETTNVVAVTIRNNDNPDDEDEDDDDSTVVTSICVGDLIIRVFDPAGNVFEFPVNLNGGGDVNTPYDEEAVCGVHTTVLDESELPNDWELEDGETPVKSVVIEDGETGVIEYRTTEVLGVIQRPPTPRAPSLPRTGADTIVLLSTALAMVLGGFVLVRDETLAAVANAMNRKRRRRGRGIL